MKILEVPVYSIDAAIAAQSAGADRIELCSGFIEGGTTPSHATILLAKQLLKIPINVMIRPRGGDFLYSETEFRIMKGDIEFCKNAGVNGIVFGILKSEGNVDIDRCKELIETAGKLSCTFHRAFDRVENSYNALEDIIKLGFDRVLTSGLKPSAIEGIQLIAELNLIADKRIIVMPGCGINSNNLKEIMKLSHSKEFHASAKKYISSKMKFIRDISMGQFKNDESKIISLDTDELIKLKLILDEN